VTRAEAIAAVSDCLADEVVVHANGAICRESFASGDRPGNFYMIGSMGLAASIGLGVALARPEKRVVIFDGDGNVLMALGTLAMVAAEGPRNFLHVVFDNGTYGSTGSQPTHSRQVPLEEVARGCGYRRAVRVTERGPLVAAVRELQGESGPTFLLVEVSPEESEGLPRIPLPPEAITDRLRGYLAGG
jgi:thiamine pyrophosphate-dependent acetolactate synthase large subunit-like protein